MKGKLLLSAGAALLCVLLSMSAAAGEINFLSTDGYWTYIDSGYDGVRIDVVGVIGSNPGAYWGSGSKTTQDDTLIRLPTVCTHDSDGDATLSEFSGISPAVYTNLGSHTFGPGACNYQGLFISEYIEGVGGDADAIELYNNANIDFDFAVRKYWIEIFNDGNTRADVVIPLTGTLLKNQTYVIASADISGVTEQLISASLSFSGNDAVALVRGYMANDSEPDDADASTWATGPTDASPTGTTGLTTDANNPSIQMGVTTDWNQVRYGTPQWPYSGFAYQSGLAFHGISRGSGSPAYGDQVPFLVGKFCHINNPIQVNNQFKNCPLTLDLMNISCGDYAVAPYPPTKMTFVYPVYLDETPNSGNVSDCPYPSTTACSDAVTFGVADSSFRCFYTGNVMNEYTVAIIGFMPVDHNASCDSIAYDEDTSAGIFISNEGTTNCGCMFAMITEGSVTAVKLLGFEATRAADGVVVSWETASETDNLGFNLYRAETAGGVKLMLNASLIPTNVPPGSPIGSVYEFRDTTAEAGKTYFYWLEDVDLAGLSTLHGPVRVGQ